MNILIVEDDQALSGTLLYQLNRNGFTADCCADGEEALYYMEQNLYDVVLLDRMLPGLDGLSVLKAMRKKNNPTPVILITALGALEDKIKGLDIGADDYLVKPFAFEELMARIRCVTRRPRSIQPDTGLTLGGLSLNTSERLLIGGSGSISLSGKECDLLETFFRNPGQLLTRSLLLGRVWGLDSDVEEGNLDNYIHFLRRRLKSAGGGARISTVRGVGYRLDKEGKDDCVS